MDNQSDNNKHQPVNKEQLRQEYIDHMLVAHAEWLKNPITVFLSQNFNKLRELHLRKLNGMVGDKEIEAAFFRAQAMNVKNTDAMIRLCFNSEAFVSMLVKDINQEQQKDNE